LQYLESVRYCLSTSATAQAGVDLGTVLEDYSASQKRGGKKIGRAGGAGVEVRPKRRAPISQVLLVGGATRMPAFQCFVTNMTGLQPKGFTVDPDEVSFHLRTSSCLTTPPHN